MLIVILAICKMYISRAIILDYDQEMSFHTFILISSMIHMEKLA